MSEIDDKIRETLRREEAELLEQMETGATLQEVMIDAYRGRHRWLNVIAFAWTFVALGMAIFAAYQFFQAETTQAMIAWATAFLWFSLWIAMLKIWFWMEMQRLPIAREIKRLELRIAELQQRLGKDLSTCAPSQR